MEQIELMKEGDIYKLQWCDKISFPSLEYKSVRELPVNRLNKEWIVIVLEDEIDGKDIIMRIIMNISLAPQLGYIYDYNRKVLKDVVILTKLN